LYRPLKEHSTGRGDPGGATRACRCHGAALRAQARGWSVGVRGACRGRGVAAGRALACSGS